MTTQLITEHVYGCPVVAGNQTICSITGERCLAIPFIRGGLDMTSELLLLELHLAGGLMAVIYK